MYLSTSLGDWLDGNISWLAGLVITILGAMAGVIWHFSQQLTTLDTSDREVKASVDKLAKDFKEHADEMYAHIAHNDLHMTRTEISRSVERLENKIDASTSNIIQRIDRLNDAPR